MEYTLDRPDVFPIGTSVGLYKRGSVPDVTRGPLAKAIATKIVGFVEEKEEKVVLGKTTAITFPAVTEGDTYIAAGQVGGVWRYVRFVAGKMGQSLKPPQRYPAHSAG